MADARDPLASALDATMRRAVPAVFFGIGILYLLVALTVLVLPGGDAATAGLFVRWLALGALGLSGGVILRRWPVPPGWANSTAGVLGILAVANSLVLVDTLGPRYQFALVVVLLGFALFLLSLPWVIALCALGMAGWVFLAATAGWGPDWAPRTVHLLAYCGVAIVVQVTRLGLHRRLETLQARDLERVRQQHELERQRALADQRRRIVRMTAHELATPMTPVLLQAHILAQGDLSPEQKRNLEMLRRNLERLRQTIDKVVTAAQAAESDASPADASAGSGEPSDPDEDLSRAA